MSLQLRIESLVLRIAAEFKGIYGQVGGLQSLATTDKTNLVSAINELRTQIQSVLNQVVIDDGNGAGTHTTFSASKITGLLDNLKAELLGGADAAFDTLKELQTAILNDQSGLAQLLAALDKRIRFDATQSLTAPEQAQARSNIGAIALTDIGNTEFDFAALLETSLA